MLKKRSVPLAQRTQPAATPSGHFQMELAADPPRSPATWGPIGRGRGGSGRKLCGFATIVWLPQGFGEKIHRMESFEQVDILQETQSFTGASNLDISLEADEIPPPGLDTPKAQISPREIRPSVWKPHFESCYLVESMLRCSLTVNI